MKLSVLAALFLVASPGVPALAQEKPAILIQPVPHKQETQPAEKAGKKPAKPVYDEAADARAQIKSALAKAKKNNRRVLVQWGGNWCPWCIKLHECFEKNAEVKKDLSYEYDVVNVDIGKFDKNMDLAKELGADFKAAGVPFLTVLDAEGKPLAQQETGPLEKGSVHDPEKVLAFLTKHHAPARDADAILKAGLQQARAENKLVFLHFGAPWCVWCHRLEDWMARPEVASTLDKRFIDIKVDQDRDTGGKELLKKYCSADEGIPWFVFLDAEGKVLTDSNGSKGNVGFPAKPEEIEHFAAMLKKAGLPNPEIAALTSSLATKK
jgi:thiol:disulfide interchange protein